MVRMNALGAMSLEAESDNKRRCGGCHKRGQIPGIAVLCE